MRSISEGEGGPAAPPPTDSHCNPETRGVPSAATARSAAVSIVAGDDSSQTAGAGAVALACPTDNLEIDDSPPTFSGSNLKLHLSEDTTPPSQPGENAPAATAFTAPAPRQAVPSKRRRMFGFRRLDDDGDDDETGGRGSGEAARRERSAAAALEGDDESAVSISSHIMTEQEIMHKYWKLTVSLFFISEWPPYQSCSTDLLAVPPNSLPADLRHWLSNDGPVALLSPSFSGHPFASSIGSPILRLSTGFYPSFCRYFFSPCSPRPTQRLIMKGSRFYR